MSTSSDTSIVERGTDLYERQLRSQLEPAHLGKFVVINVDTGEYELDEEHLAASLRAMKRWPDAPKYATRVGSRTIGRIGGGFTARRK
jgi:hypothetical protein